MIPSSAAPATAAERRALYLFLLLALLLLGAGIGLRDPWPSDEPRFALAAKQMVESGDWLFPHRGHELYSDKPPMLFWLQATVFEMVGSWRIAFLLPTLLAGLLTLVLTYDLGRRLWNRTAGLYAAWALLFVFQFMYQVKRAQIDPLVMGFITLGNWGLLIHFLRGPSWPAFWLGCFAAGLGVVTKGVGVLVFLMFVPYLFARWRAWDGVTRTSGFSLHWLGGLAAFLVPVLAWGLPVLLVARARGTPEYAAYVNDLFFHQTAGRITGSWSHPQPFWYYLPIVLFTWFPLSLAYAGAVPRWRSALQFGEARVLLPLAWALLTLLLFSVPSGKRDVYVMPALPMVALALAPYLADITAARWFRNCAYLIALGGGLLLAGGGLWAVLGRPGFAQRFLAEHALTDLGPMVWLMLVAIGTSMLIFALMFPPRRGGVALMGGLASLWLIWSLWSYPMLNDTNSAAGVMRRARELAGPATPIGMVAWKEQNLLMATGPVKEFGFLLPWDQQYAAAVEWLERDRANRQVFILEAAMGDCVDKNKARRVGRANRRDWWLFSADAVVPGCVPQKQDDDDSTGM